MFLQGMLYLSEMLANENLSSSTKLSEASTKCEWRSEKLCDTSRSLWETSSWIAVWIEPNTRRLFQHIFWIYWVPVHLWIVLNKKARCQNCDALTLSRTGPFPWSSMCITTRSAWVHAMCYRCFPPLPCTWFYTMFFNEARRGDTSILWRNPEIEV
jgi:hypothetical protein